MKKRISLILAVVLLLAAAAGQTAFGASVSNTTAQIGGKTAKLVYVSPSTVTPRIALAKGSVVSDMAAKGIVDGAAAGGQKVAAAVNGAYFNAYYKGAAGISFPNNCPRVYGTVLLDNKLINGGGTNQAATLGFTSGGTALIDWVSLSPKVTFSGAIESIHWPTGQRSFEVTPWGLNNYYADNAAVMQFTDEMTLPVTCPSSSQVVYISGAKVTGITQGGTFSVPKGSDVIVFNQTAAANAKQWDQFPAVGDAVDFKVKRTPSTAADQGQWDSVTCAIGVGPMILQNGVSVTGKDKVTEVKQAPGAVNQKSFAAVMKDGRLLLGTCVASYNQIAAYLSGIGAIDAMSLDGGASSTLYTAEKGFLQPPGRNLSNMIVFLNQPAEVYVPFSRARESVSDFSDVKGHWAESYIGKVMEQHMYSGISKTSFGPDVNMTRGMFVTALGKYAEAEGKLTAAESTAFGASAALRFGDVKASDWYGPYVGWAAENGFVTGTGTGTFAPNAPIEREQLCVILEKFQTHYQMEHKTPSTEQKNFIDESAISPWAKAAVLAQQAAGVAGGYQDGTFRPHAPITRSEAAVMLVKALDMP